MPKIEQERLADRRSESFLESMPNEVIQMSDSTFVKNFEVDFHEEEEIAYAGGIKGIRALRVQRDLINGSVLQTPGKRK